MKMKMKMLAGLLAGLMVLSTMGCSKSTTTNTGTEKKKLQASDLKLATLIPSSPTDGGWGQVGATALNNAKEKFNCKTTVVEAATADLMKSEAENLAEEGYNIIFGHGGQYAAPFAEISGKYPETFFITAGGNVVTKNQMPVEFVLEQLTYIEGAMAAKLTKTGVLGLTVGGDYPAYTKTSRAFELGAKSIKPDIKVLLGVTANSNDMNEAYEIAKTQINSGADIIFTNANQSSLGSIKAAKEKGLYIFGAVSDVSAEAPDYVVASAAQDFNGFCTSVAQKYLDGTLTNQVIKIGVEEGGIAWKWNEKVKAKLPADVVSMYDDLYAKIKSGEIKVPSENEGW